MTPSPVNRRARQVGIVVFALALVIGFGALGIWQLERRAWKLDLIARVEQQLQRPPVAAPARADWPHIDLGSEYLPVTVVGRYRHSAETLIQAMTAHGSGYWVLTPLVTEGGYTVLVNRGFVDTARREASSRGTETEDGTLTVEGFLRLSEPEGRPLRPNDLMGDRWYSRDVAAIGAARELPSASLAPYFIDANGKSTPGAWPIGGLTTVRFRNMHLVYALTWFALAGMSAGYGWLALRRE